MSTYLFPSPSYELKQTNLSLSPGGGVLINWWKRTPPRALARMKIVHWRGSRRVLLGFAVVTRVSSPRHGGARVPSTSLTAGGRPWVRKGRAAQDGAGAGRADRPPDGLGGARVVSVYPYRLCYLRKGFFSRLLNRLSNADFRTSSSRRSLTTNLDGNPRYRLDVRSCPLHLGRRFRPFPGTEAGTPAA